MKRGPFKSVAINSLQKFCAICKEPIPKNPFHSWGHYSKRQFCSNNCRLKFQVGCNNPQWKPRPTITCRNCKKPILFLAGRLPTIKRPRSFCSRKCSVHFYMKKKKGERWVARNGYTRLTTKGYEHRRIGECVLGRKLNPSEHVHHVNGNKGDNRHCNLLICTFGYHRWLHGEMAKRYQLEKFGKL